MNIYRYMAHELVKLSSYDMHSRDVFSTGTPSLEKDQRIRQVGAQAGKLAKPLAVGAGAAYGVSRLSKPLGSGPVRTVASLGAGLYGAHKANTLLNKG